MNPTSTVSAQSTSLAVPAPTESTGLTIADYLALTPDPDTRHELVEGTLVEMPPESGVNLSLARFILLTLIQHFPPEQVVWGTGIQIIGGRATARIPDVLVHTEASKAAIAASASAVITLDLPIPLLVVEVVSPGKANRDLNYRYKHTEYAALRIPEYWIVDPELQQVTVCQWIEGMYEDAVFAGENRLQSGVIPTLELTAMMIFGDQANAEPEQT